MLTLEQRDLEAELAARGGNSSSGTRCHQHHYSMPADVVAGATAAQQQQQQLQWSQTSRKAELRRLREEGIAAREAHLAEVTRLTTLLDQSTKQLCSAERLLREKDDDLARVKNTMASEIDMLRHQLQDRGTASSRFRHRQ